MIRTIISIILFTLCSHSLFGQSYRDRMRSAIDMGNHSTAFVFTDTRYTGDYADDYSCPECEYPSKLLINDIFYKLTLDRSMYLDFSLDFSSIRGTYIHILNSSGREIHHYSEYNASFWLTDGVYYFVIEPEFLLSAPSNGTITTTVYGSEREIGEDFSRPLDIGTFNSDFSIVAGVEYFSSYMMDYRDDPFLWDEYCDMVHEFTITEPMVVTMDDEGSDNFGENDYRSVLMSSRTDTVQAVFSETFGWGYTRCRYELAPGRYFIYSFGKAPRNPNELVINLTGKTYGPGSDVNHSIDIVNDSEDGFFHYENTIDTSTLLDSRNPDKAGNEVYYRLNLSEPMEICFSNCGSEVRDTYIALYSSDMEVLYYNDYLGRGACDIADQAYLQIPVLLPGTYYIMVDGATNGNINLDVDGRSLGTIGDKLLTAIDAGSYDSGFMFNDTRNTSIGYTNQFTGKSANDVYYKLTLRQGVDLLKIDHSDSELADTYLSFLNSSGTVLASSNNTSGKAYLNLTNLAAGTYYIVSEGINRNGIITTHAEVRGVNGYLSTTKGQPHVISFTPTVASSDVLSLSVDNVRQDIQYYDYFGNPTVKVQHGFSPYGDDLFTLQEYDGLNRASNRWLPVSRANTNGAYVSPGLLKDATKAFFLYGNDANPYSHTVYDHSPLNEVVEEYGPGRAWHAGNKSVKTDRMANLSSEDATADSVLLALVVRIYRVSDTSILSTGTYPTEALNVIRTTDEDGNVSYEFKDQSDRTLLVRQMDGNEMHDTYTVYDNYGNIRFVLPPLASDNLNAGSSWSENNETLKKYAYIYHYDTYNRPISKKLPGCEPVYTVYDAADRAVFTQDGNQRDKGEWSFSIPDAFSRIVLTGTCKNVFDYTANPLGSNVVTAAWSNGSTALKGYSVTGITLTAPVVLSANYYDDYEFLGKNGIPDDATTGYSEMPGYGKRYSGGCKGQLTGNWTARLTSQLAGSTYSVMYYDARYRVIQRKGNNSLNGMEAVYTSYNFEGSPVKEKRIHSVPGQDIITEVRNHTYDLANRLLQTTYQLNDDAPVILVDNVYDEIGRLKTEKRTGHSKLRTDYTYNLRSWTKGINGPLFHQTLNYQESIDGTTPCYNGNISSMTWKSGGSAATNEMGYRFTYDGLSRMKDAIYGEANTLSINHNRFNEQITGYDKMGNILGLLRYGQTSATGYGLVDNLNLVYNGNQLQSVDDHAPNSVYGNGMEFKDNANQPVEYGYDKNGNLTKDLNKNISNIRYNLINLPSQITFSDGNTIDYEYGSDRRKLRTVHQTGNTILTTDYCGNAIYENGSLKLLLTETGYVSFPDKKFHFYLKDHQGNVRVVADKDGKLEETNDYYPFGGTFTTSTSVQSYKYNGKELDRKNGLDWYDYGARMYDVAIGRFVTTDIMEEKYYSISPYVYVVNNPLKYIDLRGDSISVADLYTRDKQGELINPNQVKAFEFLASTKEGKALLANFAMKGQTIAGVTFNKDGEFHNKGINISFGTGVRDSGVSGSTNFSLNNENLNIRIVVGNSLDNADLLDTFIHEIVIHADQNSADFIDDKVMNNSNVYPALRKMDKNRQYKQHWQERNVNKAMKRIGLPILQQYYNSQGIVKSNDAIVKSMYGFLN